MSAPKGLRAGGKALWAAITDEHDLDAAQLVQLEEACRAKDACDRIAAKLAPKYDSALQKDLNATANLLKQLLAALRLPDEHGKKPQRRGARGAYSPKVPAGVSSLERARAAAAS